MFTDDIHPEELLVATRVLTPDERADLRAHVARCPACAMQLALRGDVAQALTPNEGDYEIAGRALARALAVAPSRAPAPAPALRRRAPLALRAAAVVAVMLGTGVAASAIVMTTHGRLWGVTPQRDEPARTAPERVHARPAADRTSSEVAPPSAAPVPSSLVATPPVAQPVAPAPPARARVAMRARGSASIDQGAREPIAPPAEPALPAERPPAPAPAPAPEATETDRAPAIFAAAARARREGDSTRAEHLYAQLAATFPGTREELVSRVLRGQTLLDNLGRPGDALSAFDAYLRDQPNGALAEQARAGRAQALWLLGRGAEEAAAWRELLAAYPHSLHAALARSRLAALSDAGE